MREFFRGWRRKTGVLTLVMACVFAAGWIRSLSFRDEITSCRIPDIYSIASNRGRLVWKVVHSPTPYYGPSVDYSVGKDISAFEPFSQFEYNWIRRFVGFEVAEHTNGERFKINRYSLPYWSIVLPLILLSAFLLLSKRPPVKRGESAPAEGTA